MYNVYRVYQNSRIRNAQQCIIVHIKRNNFSLVKLYLNITFLMRAILILQISNFCQRKKLFFFWLKLSRYVFRTREF